MLNQAQLLQKYGDIIKEEVNVKEIWDHFLVILQSRKYLNQSDHSFLLNLEKILDKLSQMESSEILKSLRTEKFLSFLQLVVSGF